MLPISISWCSFLALIPARPSNGNLVHQLLGTDLACLVEIESFLDSLKATELLDTVRLDDTLLQPLRQLGQDLLPESLVLGRRLATVVECSVLEHALKDCVDDGALNLDLAVLISVLGVLAGQNYHDVAALGGRDGLDDLSSGIRLGNGVKGVLQVVMAQLADLVYPIGIVVIHDGISTIGFEQIVVPLGARGDDEQTRLLGELDGVFAHGGGTAVDEHGERRLGGLAGLRELETLEEGLGGGAEGERDHRGVLVAHGLGDGVDERRLDDDVLGKGAALGGPLDEAGNALALFPRGAVGVVDGSRKVAAYDAARGCHGSGLPVCGVLGGVVNLDDDLALAGSGDGHIALDGDLVVFNGDESSHGRHCDGMYGLV